MARDPGLEQLVEEDIGSLPGLSGRAMFGGWAWLLDGQMVCGARTDGLLARVGQPTSRWALAHPGITPMMSRGREMRGWVRLEAQAYADDNLRRTLINAAVDFTRSLSVHAERSASE
jgi:hypothetical protein